MIAIERERELEKIFLMAKKERTHDNALSGSLHSGVLLSL